MAIKYSRQREAIINFLETRKDHPTADIIYSSVKKEFPNISLGTVYRNLTLLTELGEILRLNVGDNTDHFDFTTDNHYHFICKDCGSVIDLDIKKLDFMKEMNLSNFHGNIIGHCTYFYGYCDQCQHKDASNL